MILNNRSFCLIPGPMLEVRFNPKKVTLDIFCELGIKINFTLVNLLKNYQFEFFSMSLRGVLWKPLFGQIEEKLFK